MSDDDLEAVLYRQMTPAARYEAIKDSLAIGVLTPERALQALDMDLPSPPVGLPEMVSNDRIDPNEFYMVNGGQILRCREGQIEELAGSEKERVRRWLIR